MALADKNIVITPNISAAGDPKIVFSGADASTSAQNITVTAYPTLNGMLSFDGSAGQLLSVTNSLTGTIFAANDVSGIPSIEVLDTGLVKLAQYGGNVLIGTGTDDGTNKLQVASAKISSSLVLPNTTTLPTSPVTGNLRYNTTSNKFEGYSSAGWGAIGGGGGLTPTAIKTSSSAAYTAAANDLVRCDTTTGAFSITLPLSPADGDQIGIIDVAKTFTTYNLTVLPNGNKIENSVQSLILDISGSTVSLIYIAATTNWRIETTPGTVVGGGGLTPTAIKTAASAAYTAAANDLVRCDTTTGAFSITLPLSPADGDQLGVIDVANTFATYKLTVLPNGNKIENSVQSLVLDISGSNVSLLYIAATTNWRIENTPGSAPTASTTTLGLVLVPAVATSGINNTSGTIGLATASSTQLGGVKVDNSTITINGSGVISSAGGSGASATKTIANKTASYTVIAADLGKIINCTANTFTISLTAAATLGSGFTCTIWNTGTAIITIDPNLTETIDGVATLILRQGEGTDIVCDGTNWQTGSKKPMRGYAESINSTSTRPIASGSDSIALQGAESSGLFSIAIGTGCTSSAYGGISIGRSMSTSGTYTAAIGNGCSATGSYTTAIGSNASASGAQTTAIGSNSGATGSVTITGAGAMALGGSYASGVDSFAAAIANSTSTYGARGANSVAIGLNNKATGASSVAMGNGCSATGDYSIAIGWNNSAGNRSYCIGGFNSSAGDNSVVLGSWGSNIQNAYSTAIGGGKASDNSIQNKWCFSSNAAAVVGGGQLGIFVLTGSTTTATPLVLITNGDGTPNTANHIVLPNASCHAFSALIVARQSSGAGTASAAWKYEGLIRREGTAATTTLVSSTATVISNVPGWAVALTANTTYGSLVFTVTGAASTNIRWVATVSTSEVINA